MTGLAWSLEALSERWCHSNGGQGAFYPSGPCEALDVTGGLRV